MGQAPAVTLLLYIYLHDMCGMRMQVNNNYIESIDSKRNRLPLWLRRRGAAGNNAAKG